MDITERLTNSINRLFRTACKGNDRLLCEYLVASLLSNMVQKRRDAIKSELLSSFSPSLQENIERSTAIVARNESPITIDLIQGDRFSLSGQIKTGAAFTDMDLLRKALKVPESEWKRALAKATVRRKPSLVLTVSERLPLAA